MAQQCFALVNGRRMRLTKVDNCGRPIPGACSQVVTGGFVTATLSGEIDEGDEITVRNAAGEVCVDRIPCPTKRYTNAEIEFCMVDIQLFQMINPKWRALLNAAGSTVGLAMGREFSCDAGFALEIWTDVEGDVDVCDNPDAEGVWGYMLLPWLANGFVSGDLAIANDAISFTFTARSKFNSRWGAGPYDVMIDDTGNPGPLWEPVEGPDDHLIMLVDVPPPEAVCGCQPLDFTTPPAATGATAGAPGRFTPAGAGQPRNLGALTSVTADPDTEWTVGQHVRLYDGSTAYWTGSAWASGIAQAPEPPPEPEP